MADQLVPTIQALVTRSCRSHPTRVAIVYDDGITAQRRSYTDLLDGANTVRTAFSGLLSNSVGILGDPDIDLPSLLLGILSAGGYYFPLDPSSTLSYILSLINQSGLGYLFYRRSHSDLVERLVSDAPEIWSYCGWNLARIDPESGLIPIEPPLRHPGTGTGWAYMVTTSGTTSRPKLIHVPHASIVPNLQDLSRIFRVVPSDIIPLLSPLTFDPSAVETFLALGNGATLLVAPSSAKLNPSLLAEILFVRNQCSVVSMTPSLFRTISNYVYSVGQSVRVLALGGERYPLSECARFASKPIRLFNLYGISEVSCWATCQEVRLPPSSEAVNQTPSIDAAIGQHLSETLLEVRDSNNTIVVSGVGQLYVGSRSRICSISDPPTGVPGSDGLVWRATGDLVEFKDNLDIIYKGRLDFQIKRVGKRINLEEIEAVIESLEGVSGCAVLQHKHDELVAFVSEHCPFVSSHSEGIVSRIMCDLRSRLPEFMLPDCILLIDYVPRTDHGKTDRQSLRHRLPSNCHLQRPVSSTGPSFRTSMLMLASEILGVSLTDVDDYASFTSLGGNSLQAVRLVDSIKDYFPRIDFGRLFNSLLTNPLSEIIEHRWEFANRKTNTKRKSSGSSVETVAKRIKYRADTSAGSAKTVQGDEIRRCSSIGRQYSLTYTTAGTVRPMGLPQEKQTTGSENYTSVKESPVRICLEWKFFMEKCVDASPTYLSICDVATITEIVFIGSHSGLFCAICEKSGELVWSIRLANRIESSAAVVCVSQATESVRPVVTVGCYDGVMYAADAATGAEWWQFATGGVIKSSPRPDPSRPGIVYIGSHDGRVYSLDVSARRCLWSVDMGSPVFGCPTVSSYNCLTESHSDSATMHYPAVTAESPIVSHPDYSTVSPPGCPIVSHPDYSTVSPPGCPIVSHPDYSTVSPPGCPIASHTDCPNVSQYCCAATLSGRVFTLRADDGTPIWTRTLPKPVFSSPLATRRGFVLGCVDGYVYHLGNQDGSLIWHYLAGAPIFSSPCLLPGDGGSKPELVVFGCHDNRLYAVDCSHGNCVWRYEFTTAVYSSPFVGSDSGSGCDGLVAACSTDGRICLLDRSGSLLCSTEVPGNIFSSPIIVSQRIYVGCRDNFIYCFGIVASGR